MLKKLIEFNNLNSGNKLIMTTHSPYIINYLNTAIEAESLRVKIKKSRNAEDLLLRLYKNIPTNSMVPADNVVIFQLDEKSGSITKLSTYEGILSDKNYLNDMLREGNQLFDSLLEIEQEL